MAEMTTFLARNNRTVEVHAPLWNAAQSLIGQSEDGRLLPLDAIRLLAQVDLAPAGLEVQKKTLRHIRWYFRWTEDGGKALLYGLKRAGQWRWTLPGLSKTLSEVASAFDVSGPIPAPHLPERADADPGTNPAPSETQEAITLMSGSHTNQNKS